MKTKKWYLSVTVWLNIIAIIVAYADQTLELGLLTTTAHATIVGLLGAVNVALRLFKTDSATTL